MVQQLPETLRSPVANRMPRDLVQYLYGEDGAEEDSQSLILLQELNAAWQSAHCHLRGLFLRDLGIYVLDSGLVLEQTSPTSAPDSSCSSVVLHIKSSLLSASAAFLQP